MAKKKKKKKRKAARRKPRKTALPEGIAPTTGRPYPKFDVKRDAKGRLLKGSVMNPAGRGAQRAPMFDWLCEMAKEIDPKTKLPYGKIVIRKLFSMARDAETKDADKLRAICDILDRMIGKPTQRIEADVRRTSWCDGLSKRELEAVALGEAEPPEGCEDDDA